MELRDRRILVTLAARNIIRRRVVNIEKTRRALRWVPEVTLEEGLRRTVEWQRAQASRPGASQLSIA